MTQGHTTSEFRLLCAVILATFVLIVYIVAVEGADALSNLAPVLPFIYGGSGWYQHKRNKAKGEKNEKD